MEPNSLEAHRSSDDAEIGATAGGWSAVPDRVLDIQAEICPMTFVRTRLALDRMQSGEVLLVLLRGEEPRARVPATASQLGHCVLETRALHGGAAGVLIRRA